MLLDTLRELSNLPGVSGCEHAVRDYIRDRVGAADSVTTDAMGNLIVFKRGAARAAETLMLAAHMDEVGIIVTSVEDDGFLRFSFVGGIDRRVVIGRKVLLGDRLIPGVIGIKAFHLVSRDDEKSVPKVEDMYIDIGAESKAEAVALVEPGDVGVFATEFDDFGDGFVKGKAIDDRLGCAVLLELLQAPLPVDCHFVFTVQEEVGCRGALGAAFALKPDVALIIEGTTAADLPSQSGVKRICEAGRGPVIPFMDGGTIYDRELFARLRGLAGENGIPWQTKSYIAGGTDASSVQKSGRGARVAALAAAVRYLHSPCSVAAKADIEGILELSKLFLASFA